MPRPSTRIASIDWMRGIVMILLVFGQTAMFFYLAHRIVYESTATWFGLRAVSGLEQSYGLSAVSLLLLYPACRWYRTLKRRHPGSALRYF